jgi:hypothetical protein
MAEHAHTPPNPLPPILDLGRALASTEHDYRRLDDASAGRDLTTREVDAQRLLAQREEALRSLISMAPATDLVDAAVQIGAAASIASTLADGDWTEAATHERLDEMHSAVNRIMLSALPVIAAAAGLDLAAMAWDHVDELRAGVFFAWEPVG